MENNENSLLFKLRKTSSEYTSKRHQIIDELKLDIFDFVETLLNLTAQTGATEASFNVDKLFCSALGLQVVVSSAITDGNINLTNLGEKLYSNFKKHNVHRVTPSPPRQIDTRSGNTILTCDEYTNIGLLITQYLRDQGLTVRNDTHITASWK